MREGGERRQGEESAFVTTRVPSQGFFGGPIIMHQSKEGLNWHPQRNTSTLQGLIPPANWKNLLTLQEGEFTDSYLKNL
jgi:hypothetical protein